MAVNQNGRQRRPVRRYGKKKPRYDYPKIFMMLFGVVILICIVVVGFKSCGSSRAGATNEADELESRFQASIKVNGTSIQGLAREEAKAAIIEDMGWNMQVTYGDGAIHQLPNIFEQNIDEILDMIGSSEDKETDVAYELDPEKVTEAIAAQVNEIAGGWDVPAKNAGISAYQPDTGKFTFAPEESGVVVNREKLTSDITAAVEQKNFSAAITAEGVESQPEITEAQAREQYKVIGTFKTTTTSNKDRNENIRLACQAMNGMIIPAGGVFSFNDTTGERTTARGYKPAGAYVNGVLVEEPGGGVCQVSSTLYNAVIFAGLKTTERYAHSYEPSYVTPGEDAMVSFPGLDMKFTNSTKDSIGILASLDGTKLQISIYGISVLEPGVTIEMESKTTKVLDPEVPEYIEDPTLPFGQDVVEKAGVQGKVVMTDLITKKDGVEISRTEFHTSRYRGKPGRIRRNSDPNATLPAEVQTDENGLPIETTIAPEGETTVPEATQESQVPATTAVPEETSPAPTTTTAPTEAPETTPAPTTEPDVGEGPPLT